MPSAAIFFGVTKLSSLCESTMRRKQSSFTLVITLPTPLLEANIEVMMLSWSLPVSATKASVRRMPSSSRRRGFVPSPSSTSARGSMPFIISQCSWLRSTILTLMPASSSCEPR